MANLQKKGMPYVRLGNSGLKVSKIILGCMSYGTPEWFSWILPEEESIKQIKAALTDLDHLKMYSDGESERILGKAIKQLNLPRDEIVIMTKLYFIVGREPRTVLDGANSDDVGYVNQHGLSRKHIFESVKHSLERLQLDYIDLLQCHQFDYDTSIEETMQALHDVVKAGYVRYIGMSSCWAWQYYAIANKLTPFISMQNHYSLVYREEEREMFPTLKYLGVGSIPWAPLGRGVLARPLSKFTARGKADHYVGAYSKGSESTAKIVNRVEEVAKKRGISMAQVALAWMFQKDGVTAPIVGVTSSDHLQDIIGSVRVQLTPDEVKYLEEPYAPQAIIGHT
ncbi:hypothetical protein M378DRAFT_186761 [Amanita muscaria Koide BX008]|uniref:NADP-dependent oxidoreductase domain-containing protein n=1 Tax=Amanita muscaria (strain Koide BX008) TaxID=946122 RepID=A0A0C2WRP1_AMAMK|nr:hypothetical protein M378DRAFT_186761 [Amanita muscaria Koide BX008]